KRRSIWRISGSGTSSRTREPPLPDPGAELCTRRPDPGGDPLTDSAGGVEPGPLDDGDRDGPVARVDPVAERLGGDGDQLRGLAVSDQFRLGFRSAHKR